MDDGVGGDKAEAAEEGAAVEGIAEMMDARRNELLTKDVERMIILRPTLIADDAVAIAEVPADGPGSGGSGGTLHVSIAILNGNSCLRLKQTAGNPTPLSLRSHS